MFGLNLKVIGAVLAAALASTSLAYIKGSRDGSASAVAFARAEAVKETSRRIATMEKTNAEFRALSAGDLCRRLAADSGLPASACDD
jgi:hypothetical protein